MVPALKGSRANLYEALSEGGRSGGSSSSHRLRGALVVSEVALALTLLVGAGLLIRSFARLVHVDPGFDPRGVLTFSIAIPGTRYPDQASQDRFFDDVLAGISRLPGVKAAGATNALPFGGEGWSTATFSIEGRTVPAGEQRPGATCASSAPASSRPFACRSSRAASSRRATDPPLRGWRSSTKSWCGAISPVATPSAPG